jgi:small subunit ribosomal protein S4
MLAKPDEKKQKELFDSIIKQGLRCTKLDDVLSVKLEDILSRRLQTMVFKKGLAITPKHARQLIVHKHISIEGRKIAWPSYIVPAGMEDKIELEEKAKSKAIEATNE